MRVKSLLKKPRVRLAVKLLLALLIAAAAVVVIKNGEKWLEQIGTFSWQLDWKALTLSVLLLGISYYFIPVGWMILSRSAGCEADDGELRQAWFLSQLGRYIPGKVWLFAGRAAFLKTKGLTGYRATMVPFLELLYTAAGVGIAAVVPVVISRGSVFSSVALRGAVIAAGVSVAAIPFLKPIQKKLYRIKYGSVPNKLPLPGVKKSAVLLLLYSALWWIRGISLFLWLQGFGFSSIAFFLCLSAAPLSWLAGYIVFIVPGGIGVKEAATVALIAPAGSAGPVLAVVAGQRLILSVIEVFSALMAAGRAKFFGKGKQA